MTERRIVRYSGEDREFVDDVLVDESPVEFRLAGVPLAVLMRTPGHDRELAIGFAITEGIVIGPREVADVQHTGAASGDRYDIVLSEGVTVDPEQFRRNLFTSSSCGVCGKASIDAVRVAARHVPDGPIVERGTIASLPDAMRGGQQAFTSTGSIHAAAAFSGTGELLEIGRAHV